MAKIVRRMEKENEFAEVSVTENVIPVYKWRKIGGGALRMPNKIVKPNQIFEATEAEIPNSFMKSVVKLGVVSTISKEVEFEEDGTLVKSPKYILQHRGGPWWDIVDSFEKVVNEKALRRDDAEELLGSLNEK